MNQNNSVAAVNIGTLNRVISTLAGGILCTIAMRQVNRLHSKGVGTAGVFLVARGLTGHCPFTAKLNERQQAEVHSPNAALDGTHAIRIERTITVDRPQQDVYLSLRNFDQFPVFMKNILNVKVTDDIHSHWTIKGPMGHIVEWDAEIINDEPDHRLAWKTVGENCVAHAGTILLSPAKWGQGTDVRVILEYHTAQLRLGNAIARLMGSSPDHLLADDLRRFKEIMETGHTAQAERNELRKHGIRPTQAG